MNLVELGKVIRMARKQRKLTQVELSTQLGLSRATLSALENGTVQEIGIRKVMSICALLGLELNAQAPQSKRPTLHHLVTEAEQRKRSKNHE
ncbi:helix-turn-helix domain-containing protein [Thiolinea disciformis]|uniref:helix-turn-helix domain-containing protein n=1 Tax=Thiolinea disciformis TaxID=125614 RepID=UPI0003679E61|nr:helix-turn-helix transcriptional regulator [Thiolinea disciformis]